MHFISFSSYNGYKLNSHLTCFRRGFIAQLVEHRTGIAEVMGSNPLKCQNFFWALFVTASLHNCEDLFHLYPLSAVHSYRIFINIYIMTFYAHSYQSLNCTGAQIPILSRPKICYSFISGSSTLDKRRRGSLAQLEFRGLQSWEHQTREVPDERKSFVSHDSWYVYVPSPWRRKCTVPGLSTETAKCRIVSELMGVSWHVVMWSQAMM